VPNYASYHKYIWEREVYLHTLNLGTTDERSPSNTPSTSSGMTKWYPLDRRWVVPMVQTEMEAEMSVQARNQTLGPAANY